MNLFLILILRRLPFFLSFSYAPFCVPTMHNVLLSGGGGGGGGGGVGECTRPFPSVNTPTRNYHWRACARD